MKFGKEITERWDEIKDMESDGSFMNTYTIGDYKKIDLGEDGIIRMRIAGFEKDIDEFGNSVPVTWIADDPTLRKHKMHNDWFGEYSKTDLRKWLNKELIQRLPDDLKKMIIPVLKRQVAYTPDWRCYTDTVVDKLWIPSFSELFEGGYPELFSDNESRAMAVFWWLRSADGNSDFSGVNTNGSYDNNYADYSLALALGFSS